MLITDLPSMKQILSAAKTIAVVGHSDNPSRTSYQIAQRMKDYGYTIYPVNPTVKTIDGKVSYPSLADVPVKIDIVNVFRRAEHLPGVVQEAIPLEPLAVWGQLGVAHPEAERLAIEAKLPLIANRCIKVVYQTVIP